MLFRLLAVCALWGPAHVRPPAEPPSPETPRLVRIDAKQVLASSDLNRWIALPRDVRVGALERAAFGLPGMPADQGDLAVAVMSRSGPVVVPLANRQVLTELGAVTNSTALVRHATTIETAMRLAAYLDEGPPLLEQAFWTVPGVDGEHPIRIHTATVDAVMAGSAVAIAEVTAEAQDPERPEDQRLTLGALLERLMQSIRVVADSARREARLLAASAAERHAAVRNRTVAIFGIDECDRETFLGSGVLLERTLVATAAHVVAQPWLAVEPGVRPLQTDFGRIRVGWPGGDAGCFEGTPRLVVESGSVLFPELDAAVLRLRPPEDPAGTQWLASALSVPIEQSRACSDADIGGVFGYSATRDAERPPALAWIEPGDVVFPAEVLRPAVKEQIIGDRRFLMALLNHADDVCPLVRTMDHFEIMASQMMAQYASCDSPASPLCRLTGPVGEPALVLFTVDKAFRADPKIVCFAANVGSVPGCSGAPIYRAGETPMLLGLISGRMTIPSQVAGCNGAPRPYAQIVPWALVRRAWTEHQEKNP